SEGPLILYRKHCLLVHLPRYLARSQRPRDPSLKSLERETGIEPATNSLEGCDSTTELLPPDATGPTAKAVGLKLPKTLELMTGIEPVTSPLPRECSPN